MAVKLIASTVGQGELTGSNAEDIIVYAARVSNPKAQANFNTGAKLLRYCLNEKHFSIFETASMTVEVKTSRAIAEQIIRHKSFNFQQFSQRYSEVSNNTLNQARRQDFKNRQNSIDDLDEDVKAWFTEAQNHVWNESYNLYKKAIDQGIAKECARFLLPLSTETCLYMTGNFRSFYHYVELRSGNGTQLEHQAIALAIKQLICLHFPKLAVAFNWNASETDHTDI